MSLNLLSANSTVKFVEPRGFDYFWVPGNLHVIHIDYPYDFILYAFMVIGIYYVVASVYNVLVNGWRQ